MKTNREKLTATFSLAHGVRVGSRFHNEIVVEYTWGSLLVNPRMVGITFRTEGDLHNFCGLLLSQDRAAILTWLENNEVASTDYGWWN